MTFLATPPRLTEKRFQQQVLELARLCGWAAYHTHDSRRSSAGFPDLVLTRRPRVIFAELKSDRGAPSPAQRAWIDELRACGQEAYIWRPEHWSGSRGCSADGGTHQRQGAHRHGRRLVVLALRHDGLGDLGPRERYLLAW